MYNTTNLRGNERACDYLNLYSHSPIKCVDIAELSRYRIY